MRKNWKWRRRSLLINFQRRERCEDCIHAQIGYQLPSTRLHSVTQRSDTCPRWKAVPIGLWERKRNKNARLTDSVVMRGLRLASATSLRWLTRLRMVGASGEWLTMMRSRRECYWGVGGGLRWKMVWPNGVVANRDVWVSNVN